jgi:hypothetical protein
VVQRVSRWWSVGVVALGCLVSSMAFADEVHVVTLTAIPGGGEEQVIAALQEIEELDVRDSAWFYQQVRGRAFSPQGVGDRASDVMWVMRGSNIDIVIHFREESDDELLVRFLTAEEGLPAHEFHVDRGEEGPTRGGIRLIRGEMERYIGVGQPEVIYQAPIDESEIPVDPAVARERALAAEAARAERLQRDWLWARAHIRMFRKDFAVAGAAPSLSFTTGFFPGLEIDIEAFPFVLGNADMVEPGVYLTYNHGFDGLRLIDESHSPPQETILRVNILSVEGGLIYRLDSPLDENQHRNRQLRFKLGGRYETYAIPENPVRPATSLVSLVVGTRLVLPIPLIGEEFGITAAVDIIPVAGFVDGATVFGGASANFGFGSELGVVYEVVNKLFLSAGYSFRMMRSIFSGVGTSGLEDASLFDLNQGLRAGVVYQY